MEIRPQRQPPRETWVYAKVSFVALERMTDQAFSIRHDPYREGIRIRYAKLIDVRTDCKKLVIHC